MAGSKKKITIASTEPQARKVMQDIMKTMKRPATKKKAKKK